MRRDDMEGAFRRVRDLPGGGAGGPSSGPRVRPEDAGPDLLKAGCGVAATDAPGGPSDKGRACVPIPDRIDTAGVSCYL